jgi:hypothetical protein
MPWHKSSSQVRARSISECLSDYVHEASASVQAQNGEREPDHGRKARAMPERGARHRGFPPDVSSLTALRIRHRMTSPVLNSTPMTQLTETSFP